MTPSNPRTRVLLLPAVVLAVVVVAAAITFLATRPDRHTSAAGTGAASATVTAPAAIPPEPTVVGDTANGSTLHLRPGQTLRVVLGSPSAAGSTYWSFRPLASGVLAELSGPSVAPARTAAGCSRPGVGCGTVALTVTARTAGTAQVAASRNACGEAMRCPPGRDTFTVTVIVN